METPPPPTAAAAAAAPSTTAAGGTAQPAAPPSAPPQRKEGGGVAADIAVEVRRTLREIGKVRGAADSLRSLLELHLRTGDAARAEALEELLALPSALADLANLLLHPRAGDADDPVCQWLYGLYWDGRVADRLFVLRLVPVLVYALLVRRSRLQLVSGIAAVLLAIYESARARRGPPLVAPADDPFAHLEVSLPDLSAYSIYARSSAAGAPGSAAAALPSTAAASAMASGLRQGGAGAGGVGGDTAAGGTARPVLPPVDLLTRTAAQHLVQVALSVYLQAVSEVGRTSQLFYCAAAMRLAGVPLLPVSGDVGLDWDGTGHVAPAVEGVVDGGVGSGGGGPAATIDTGGAGDGAGAAAASAGTAQGRAGRVRPGLTEALALLLLRGLNHCLAFEWARPAAREALMALHARATEELWPGALLYSTSALELQDDTTRRDERAALLGRGG